MIVLKVLKSWNYVGALPLFQALVLDGAMYYLVIVLTFSLNIVSIMNSEVSSSTPLCLMR